MDAWPDEIYGFKVEHEPTGSAGTLLTPVSIVLHTTETSGPIGFYPDPPNFETSSGRIRQFRGVDEWSAALRHDPAHNPFGTETNAFAAQIEIVGFSQQKLWQPDEGTMERTAAVMAYFAEFHGVPLVVPNPDWKDDGSDIVGIWASRNSRRKWAELHWPYTRGVWMHLEVPWQAPTWHWDAGGLARRELIARAEDMGDGMASIGQLKIAEQKGYTEAWDFFGLDPADKKHKDPAEYLAAIDDSPEGEELDDEKRAQRIGRRKAAVDWIALNG